MRDVAKISKALERPGIDPRKFVELAVVTAVAVDANGVHADVITSDGLPETAALVTPYGGPGFGFYGPIDLDDAVLLAVPDGKYNAGARIVGRLWDHGSPPPAEVAAHPDDVAIVIKPGQTIRIVVSGGGNVIISARDGGKIMFGDDDTANDPGNAIIRKRDLDAYHDAFVANHKHSGVSTGGGTSGPPLPGGSVPSGSSLSFTK